MVDNATLRTREIEPASRIPHLRHVDPHVIALSGGAFMTMIAIEGIAFETAAIETINARYRGLDTTWRNIADDRLAVWSHVIRRRESTYPTGDFGSPFAASLNARYRERMVGQDLYRNELYISLVWTGTQSSLAKVAGLAKRARKSGLEVDAEAVKRLTDASQTAMGLLADFRPRLLGLYDEGGLVWSEPCEVLHQLVGGRREKVPLTMGPIHSAIYSDRVIFGRETVEIRHEADSRIAGILSLKEYPARTQPGMLDGLLALPCEFILSQSFAFRSKGDALALFTRKQNMMTAGGDKAVSQIDELLAAADDVQANRIVMGEHHLSLLVFGANPKQLGDNLAKARAELANGGAVVAREDIALEAVFWGQLPGNFSMRPRSGAISSRNFAALSPLHSYPLGQADGNFWGPAVAMLKTASGAPFYFNFHHEQLGSTFICGPSGSGKTALMNFLLTQITKHAPRVVLFDKDRGAELFVRAMGGTYFPLLNGRPTGFSPLKGLDLTPANKVFLARWIERLVRGGRPMTASEQREVEQAIDAMSQLDRTERSIAGLIQFLNTTDPDGVAARLRRWAKGGALGWVFDNDADDIGEGARFLGYDMTDFLDNEEIRVPLMFYLFHRVEQMINGERIIVCIDEFWKALADEGFRDFVQNKLKTIRKQNGLMVFATQSPRDAISSPIAHTVIEQCGTQIFLPNEKGQHRDYVEGFRLTEREYELISRDLQKSHRRFIVKQGHGSVVAELNLVGFGDEMSILSGTTAGVEDLEAIRREVGDDPSAWLPIFYDRRRRA
ncbi:VirB4 family type IV secretion/conjugal transfer ATPase [Xanthobacter sp. V13C-7B]|uniref:VirB4 family type IV secretion/conjugal transfer ATPase n=1 Tax=Xanthobacter variabilis TaxID=3119932 RepID=UPI00372B008B